MNNVTNVILSGNKECDQKNFDIQDKNNVSDKESNEGTLECAYDCTNGYYVEITEFNHTKQVITYFNGIRSNNYIKTFNNQPFQNERLGQSLHKIKKTA